jgi:Flp pilus assembly protein TadG
MESFGLRPNGWGKRVRGIAAGESGAELLEFAFVVQMLLMLLIGIFWIGRAYNTYESITRAAREGTKALVLTSCAMCTPANTPYTASEVHTDFVDPALVAATLDPTKVQGYTSQFVFMDTDNATCGVQVSFTYPFQVAIPFTEFNADTINLHTAVQMRLENQPDPSLCTGSVP